MSYTIFARSTTGAVQSLLMHTGGWAKRAKGPIHQGGRWRHKYLHMCMPAAASHSIGIQVCADSRQQPSLRGRPTRKGVPQSISPLQTPTGQPPPQPTAMMRLTGSTAHSGRLLSRAVQSHCCCTPRWQGDVGTAGAIAQASLELLETAQDNQHLRRAPHRRGLAEDAAALKPDRRRALGAGGARHRPELALGLRGHGRAAGQRDRRAGPHERPGVRPGTSPAGDLQLSAVHRSSSAPHHRQPHPCPARTAGIGTREGKAARQRWSQAAPEAEACASG